MEKEGGEGRCGSQMDDKISEGYKDKEMYKTASYLIPVFCTLYVFMSAVDMKCVNVYTFILMCVHVCQVCVNRDERHRVRAWLCIIHEADLAEESQGSPALL